MANQNNHTIKVIDFGITGLTLFDDYSQAGTLKYMAPEILTQERTAATPAIDVWSLGVIMYAMLCGALPFVGECSEETRKMVISKKITFPKDVVVSDPAKRLIQRMLDKDPDRRISLMEIENHPWYLAL